MIVVMNNGRIEQVGTPQEVYETPKTRFVAGFVGSPPMNFFRGRLVGEADRVTIETGTARFVMPRSLASNVSGSVREIDLGVRPQHVALTEGREEGALPVTVYAVERLGMRMSSSWKTRSETPSGCSPCRATNLLSAIACFCRQTFQRRSYFPALIDLVRGYLCFTLQAQAERASLAKALRLLGRSVCGKFTVDGEGVIALL
jgi:ABC-type sugar transport system ATPase subunit